MPRSSKVLSHRLRYRLRWKTVCKVIPSFYISESNLNKCWCKSISIHHYFIFRIKVFATIVLFSRATWNSSRHVVAVMVTFFVWIFPMSKQFLSTLKVMLRTNIVPRTWPWTLSTYFLNNWPNHLSKFQMYTTHIYLGSRQQASIG